MPFDDQDLESLAWDIRNMHLGQLNTVVRRLLRNYPDLADEVCRLAELDARTDRHQEQEYLDKCFSYKLREIRGGLFGLGDVDDEAYARDAVGAAFLLIGSVIRSWVGADVPNEKIASKLGSTPAGWLHHAIHLLLDSAPAASATALEAAKVRKGASWQEDRDVLESQVGLSIRKRPRDVVNGAIMLIGRHLRPARPSHQADPPFASFAAEQAAALTLVIRASRLPQLSPAGSMVTPSLAADLIGEATYFRCGTLDEINSTQSRLVLCGDLPSSTSEQDIYLRLEIDPGQELIGKANKFSLRQALRAEAASSRVSLALVMRLDTVASEAGLKDFRMS